MPEKSTWAAYRKLQRKVLLLWGGGFPVLAILAVLPRDWVAWLFGPLLVLGLGYGIVLAYLSLRLSFWPCPRCGKLFFLRFGILPTYNKRCPHCGLGYGG